jgi:hypothetical protein
LDGVSENAKQYRVIAVYGSPRRGGNTDVLLDTFLRGLDKCDIFKKGSSVKLKTNKLFVSELDISPCRECRHCSIDGDCIVDDDMQKVYPEIVDCELLLIASPIFFTTVSGYLKAFIDRFQRFWAMKYELDKNIINRKDKRGILFSCAGSKPENIFDCTKKVTRALFDVLYIEYYADFLYNNIDFKGDILKKPEYLDEVYEFGKKGDFIIKGR